MAKPKKKKEIPFAPHQVRNVRQVPMEQRTADNLRPMGTVAATRLGNKNNGISLKRQCVELVTALGHMEQPIWEQLADSVIVLKYGREAVGKAVAVASRARDYADNPGLHARALLLDGRADELERAEPVHEVEGLCCDCVQRGPCCTFDENTGCEHYRDDGSCWTPWQEEDDATREEPALHWETMRLCNIMGN